MLKIDDAWTPTFDDDHKDVLSTDSRKLLCKESNMNKANLSVYAKSLFEKGALIKNEEGGSEVNPILKPTPVGDIVEFTFTLDMKQE